MNDTRIPTLDLRPWAHGGAGTRAATGRTVGEAPQTAGFLLVTGHGVDPARRSGIREAARAGSVRTPRPTAARRGRRPRRT